MIGSTARLLGLAAGLAMAAPLRAQDSTSWSRASAAYGFEAFTKDRSPWHAVSAGVTFREPRSTSIAELALWDRFDQADAAVIGDLYRVLRRGTYVEVRLHFAPDADVVAQSDFLAELYQATGRGFEVSAGYRHMKYSSTDVHMANASVAKYTGDWYLRARGTAASQEGAPGFALGFLARRTFASADDLVEAQGGFGKEVVILAPGSFVLAPTANVAARFQRRLGEHWGLSISGSWNRQEGIPNRAGLTFGVFRVL